MVFQSYALYPHMTVEQNMAFALRMRKEDPATIRRRVAEAIDILALKGLERRKPGQLSGGQRQRVAMGRCIVRNPKLFLFDEPLSNLDAKLRAQTRIEIRRLHERLNATSIFVTHDQIEAMTMADRIALLKDGRLQQIGTPQDLYLQPKNRFVAGFLGTPEMNMFAGTLTEDADGFRLDGAQTLRLPASPARRAALRAALGGRKVEIGVRPEHLVRVAPATADALALRIDVVEWLGHDVYLFCDRGNARPVVIRHAADVEANAPLPKAGEPIAVRPIGDLWHVFDAETGDSLLA
jgi:ABC-type sugar transport system ATPase subunit